MACSQISLLGTSVCSWHEEGKCPWDGFPLDHTISVFVGEGQLQGAHSQSLHCLKGKEGLNEEWGPGSVNGSRREWNVESCKSKLLIDGLVWKRKVSRISGNELHYKRS